MGFRERAGQIIGDLEQLSLAQKTVKGLEQKRGPQIIMGPGRQGHAVSLSKARLRESEARLKLKNDLSFKP